MLPKYSKGVTNDVNKKIVFCNVSKKVLFANYTKLKEKLVNRNSENIQNVFSIVKKANTASARESENQLSSQNLMYKDILKNAETVSFN